ncbi:MAG: hypothetical protein K8I01_01410 [Candidatus Methylomirabilis sp.]|nr:hypothetical protein [Deltaproteobacteria bacterium]
MAEVIGVMNCPVCGSEVNVKRNSNKKPTLYCKVCRVQVTSSGGQSMDVIMSQVRQKEPPSTPLFDGEPITQKQEVNADVVMVQDREYNGQGVPDAGRSSTDGRGFLSFLWNGR